MNDSWVDDWDAQQAWNERCRGKSPPDSAVIVKLKPMFRHLMATRDEADATLDNLRSQDLPDLDLERFIKSDGLMGLHATMMEKGATVVPSDKLRKLWHRFFWG